MIDGVDPLKRLTHAVKQEPDATEVEDVMGAMPPVSDSTREIFTFYCDKLAVSEAIFTDLMTVLRLTGGVSWLTLKRFDGRGDPHQFRSMLSPEDGA